MVQSVNPAANSVVDVRVGQYIAILGGILKRRIPAFPGVLLCVGGCGCRCGCGCVVVWVGVWV